MTHGHAPSQYAQYQYPQYEYARYGQDHYRDDSQDDLYPPPPPPARGVNPLAVVALVLGLFGWFVISIPCGVVALQQIKRTGQKGRDAALAGLTFSGLWAMGFTCAFLLVVLEASAG